MAKHLVYLILDSVLKGINDIITSSITEIFNASIQEKFFKMILRLLLLLQSLNVGTGMI